MSEQVIWQRVIDYDKIDQRKQRFLKMFVGPAVAILLVVVIFTGLANGAGAAIVLGIVGLAWWNTVRYKSLSDQSNPTMTFDGERLSVGERSVLVADVKRYTTMATSIQTSVLGKYSRIHLGKVVFRTDNPGTRRDPQLVEFGWPNMDEAEVDRIDAALEPILRGRKVEPTELLTEDELSERTRRRPRPI